MKKRTSRPPDVGPGITRLMPRKLVYGEMSAEDHDQLRRAVMQWAEDRETWLDPFDVHVASTERLCMRLAPDWQAGEPSTAAWGTVVWIAEKILNDLERAREHQRHWLREARSRATGPHPPPTSRSCRIDVDPVEAFNLGLWTGHLLAKLGWESDALRGERVAEGGRQGGKLGGRARLIDDPERLAATGARLGGVIAANGAERVRWAEALAAIAGVKTESVLRAARRHRKRSR